MNKIHILNPIGIEFLTTEKNYIDDFIHIDMQKQFVKIEFEKILPKLAEINKALEGISHYLKSDDVEIGLGVDYPDSDLWFDFHISSDGIFVVRYFADEEAEPMFAESYIKGKKLKWFE